MDLVTARGTEIGDIKGIVQKHVDRKQFVLIQRGGFLGFGSKKVAVPLENIAVGQNNTIMLHDLEVAQLDVIPEFKNEDNTYWELDGSQTVSLVRQR